MRTEAEIDYVLLSNLIFSPRIYLLPASLYFTYERGRSVRNNVQRSFRTTRMLRIQLDQSLSAISRDILEGLYSKRLWVQSLF